MNANVETVYEELDSKLRRSILRRVSDHDAAEDILQEVYIRVHSHMHSLRDVGKLQSWIYQITRNAIIDYYRSQKPTVELPETLAQPETPDEYDGAGELALSVRAMIDCLPAKYREAILLTEYEGLTQKQMAERLGISWSGAKSRVQRARQKLKDMLLDCCHVELDRRGNVLDYQPGCGCCLIGHSPGDSVSF